MSVSDSLPAVSSSDRRVIAQDPKPLPACPAAWLDATRALAGAVEGLADGRGAARDARGRVEAEVERLKSDLLREVSGPQVSDRVPGDLRRAVLKAVDALRQGQTSLLDQVARCAEDFEHAAENEDRFVVLVFGEVNCGKSALANHVAGLEFEIPPDVEASSFFVSDRSVERLEESPVECTRDYQGFRRPGLLWIDCPGVLSGTFANADLARRLVRRADLVVLVSSSDAPFKRTEMAELARLIRESGNQRVEAILVVSKFDVFDETVDPRTGRIAKNVRRKDRGSETGQTVWCREELESTGLLPYIRNPEPIPLSVYLARQSLGRRWIDGRPGRSPSTDWPRAYEASGVPAFLARLAAVVRAEGAAIKAAWPAKRRQALKAAVDAVCDRSESALTSVADRFRQERARLAAVRKPACDEAAEAAAASVAAALKKSVVHDPGAFDQASAERRLQERLAKAVRRALDRHVQPILASIGAEIDAAMKEYVGRTRFDLSVQARFVTRTYTSTAKGEGWGAGIGGGAGGFAGFELGVALGAVLGPVGSLACGLLFGLVGTGLLSEAGRWFGREFGGETRTVRVAAGTNADEVVAATAREMGAHAGRAVGEAFELLDRTIFGQILGELSRLSKNVGRWRGVLGGSARGTPRGSG